MTDTMTAARFAGGGRIELVETPVPVPLDDEVLVRVDSCALCGTDRGAFLNGSGVIPGHEISGTVVAMGDLVADMEVETRGVVYLVDFCGRCACCRTGSTNMCLAKRHMYGFTADGGYAEYVAVRSQCFLAVAEDLALDGATALLDLLGTSGHAFRRVGRAPRRVAVVGCGPIGIGAISIAISLGARRVCGVDISPYRLELVSRIGATPVDARAEDPIARCLEIEPDGFDVVVEAAGHSATQLQAIALASAGGTVVFIAHNHEPIPVNTLRELIQFEKSLIGSEYFPIGEFNDNYDLLESQTVPVEELITHRFPLARIQDAFDLFMSGSSGKILIRP
jgi:threonine 3-dehydrogenase